MARVIPEEKLKEILQNFNFSKKDSHKGDNGRLLVIGGSELFHAAILWSAEVASYFVDIVHFSSTKENEQIFLNLKTKFTNGIVIKQEHLFNYASEDDCILIGPGMVREGEEAKRTLNLTKQLIDKFPHKKFVFDAGAMQVMDPMWLSNMTEKPIVTPHQREFETLFGTSIERLEVEEKKRIACDMAKRYKCIILLKAIVDIVTDGERTVIIEGGNAGLTKGGTGDTLSGLVAALSTTNDSFESAVLGSFILKSSAETLEKASGNWFSTQELITTIPHEAHRLLKRLSHLTF